MNIFSSVFLFFPQSGLSPLNSDVYYSRFKREILEEVQQEFLVTKTIQEVEASREMDVNFVGVYITADDKVSEHPLNFLSQPSESSCLFV
jgi:hypothetical protein